MRWKTKATLQNAIALLPSSLSYATYYRLQRLCGGLRHTNPEQQLTAGVQIWKRILQQRRDPIDKVFFEVGTGRAPIVPLSLWLMGARRTITMDVNPYLERDVVCESVAYIGKHRTLIEDLFGQLLQPARLASLLRLYTSDGFSLERFLHLCGIDYVQPGDATRTGLSDDSVDYHISYTVFEHIPPDILSAILVEGTRILRQEGLCVHMIDYSDHFSHSDATISGVNFLQYSDEQWARFAGNRYMYMNRLRHDDVIALFEAAGQQLIDVTSMIDDGVLGQLREGSLHLDQRFSTKSTDVLAIRGAWVVSRKEANETIGVSSSKPVPRV
jgi:hypothetical protein